MEINDLRIFQRVAYEKSISKAALSLGYAQSNITMRIKILEARLNTKLFIRTNTGTNLTLDGEKLIEYADKIIKLVDEATCEFITPKVSSKLLIGATQALSAGRVSKLFALFHEQNPETSLALKTDRQEMLVEKLINNEVDGIFIYDNSPLNNMKKVYTFKEEVALISYKEIYDIRNINLPLIINTDKSCPYGTLLKKWCSTTSSESTSIIEFDTLESILNAINNGLGVSLLPKSILNKNHDFYVYDLDEEFKTLNVNFVINEYRNTNDTLKKFINLTKIAY